MKLKFKVQRLSVTRNEMVKATSARSAVKHDMLGKIAKTTGLMHR